MPTQNTADEAANNPETLDVLVGRWAMRASFDTGGGPPLEAETTFEWLEGRKFLVQRWHVDHPDAPDGIAIIGYDDERATFLQHYFDSRGVARVYEMGLGKEWRLERIVPGFSQRFTGVFQDSGDTIAGRWEFSQDGTSWEPDFDLTYTRSRP